MTEKRFRLGYVCGDYGLIDNDEWIDLHSMSENSEKNVQICINKMNELSDENEQLRNKKERYKRLSEIRQQEINNRIFTIKEFINNCSDNKVRRALKKLFYSEVNEYDLSSENRKLLKENEQLKSRIKEVTELLSEEVDLFSDKATEHDINAYMELKELDNKDAFYMATATKKAIRMLKELQRND